VFSKPPKRSDPAILDEIRVASCFKCRNFGAEPHHLPSPFGGSRRAVDIAVPLCRTCHRHYHDHPDEERADLDTLYAHALSFYAKRYGVDWEAIWRDMIESLVVE